MIVINSAWAYRFYSNHLCDFYGAVSLPSFPKAIGKVV